MKNLLAGIGKNKALVMLGIAVVIALIVSLMVYNFLQKTTQVKQTTYALETQPVAVAQVDLQWGTVLTKEMIKSVPYLKDSLPAGYISDLSAVGRTLISPVKANEPILESRLAPTSVTTGGVAAIITPKKRAMAVRVDKVVGVSGFVFPGNRVDILVTMTPRGTGKETSTPITKIVLEDILVLAAGSEIEQGSKQEKSKQVDVITLEVTPEDGEKLALAASEGKIQLALRNFTDNDDVMTRGTTSSRLLASYSGGTGTDTYKHEVKAVRRPLPVSEAPKSFNVEVINGDAVSVKRF